MEIRYEKVFQCKNFKYGNVPIEYFYASSWSDNRIHYVIFRAIMFAWALAWKIYYWVRLGSTYDKATNWADMYVFLYYFFALVVAGYGAATRNSLSKSTPGVIRVLQVITWVLHSASFAATLVVVILYWALLAGPEAAAGINLADPLNIYKHALIFVGFIIDLYVIATPVRILHFPVAMLGTGLYALFYVCVWAVNKIVIYQFLDLTTNSLISWILMAALAFVWPLVSQLILYGLYMLRMVCTATKRPQSRATTPMRDVVIINDNAVKSDGVISHISGDF